MKRKEQKMKHNNILSNWNLHGKRKHPNSKNILTNLNLHVTETAKLR